jgi:glutamyl-tRNA reductase
VPFIIVGLSHKTAPLEIREKLSFTREELAEIAVAITSVAEIEEGVVLSTCNRTEVFGSRRQGVPAETAIQRIRDFLSRTRSLDPAELDLYLYAHQGLDAVRHLFRVASSLDSMVVGEPQILGQVKEAYNLAVQAGSLGPRLDGLMQRAFSVAKRVRASTQISRNPVSISYAAVELAGKIFGTLAGRSVMLIGAGKMADLAARHLVDAGARDVLVASRTFHHAQELAAKFNGVPITLDRFREHLPRVDIVVSSTSAPHYILYRDDAQKMMKERRGRAIFIIDIAVPRDIDPECNKIDNLYLYDIDALQGVVDAGLEERRREAVLAEAIVEEEVTQYHTRAKARDAAPAIVALRQRLHGLAEAELQRFRGRLGPLSEKQEATVRDLVASLVNKILHGPTREMKGAGRGAATAEMIEMVHRMFDLETEEEPRIKEPAHERDPDRGGAGS